MLANDLKEYGKGYSYDQLKRMSMFANVFSDLEIRAQVVPQIPWGTIIVIMQKSKTHEEMRKQILAEELEKLKNKKKE